MDGILSSALSALQTNSAALRVVSNNVANLNTQGYARRVVDLQTQNTGGQITGVDIADIQRVADQFLDAEALSANSASSQYSAQTGVYSQLNSLLGQPGDNSSLTSQLSNVFSALGSASLDPGNSTNQQSIVTSFQNLTNTVSNLSTTVSNLRNQVDQQVSTSVGTANSLIQQIYTLNGQIATATVSGDDASSMLDARATALNSLSQMVGVRMQQNSDGTMTVMTNDGVNLVGATYAQLSYTPGAQNGNYGPITLQNINPATGNPSGPAQAFDSHLGSGQILGLIQMRDGSLADFQAELGNFAQQTANAFNAQHNANTAFPPPTTLNGSNTGLLATDALNFTGKTTVAVTDSSGNLVSRVDIDFSAGTLSVDGGTAQSLGTTVGSFTTALNAALGSNGTASFSNGELTVGASGSNGIVVQDDATTPSSRGGAGFSQFFGLNNLIQTSAPSISATGLSASDASGLAAGGTISFSLRGPNGEVGKTASITTTAGMSIGDVVTALNNAMGGEGTFSLSSNGALTMKPAASAAGYHLDVTQDTTQRGTTGLSFSQVFGLGTQSLYAQAQGLSVKPSIVSNPSTVALAQSSLTATTAAGTQIVASGDARGLLALQNVGVANQTFQKAGGLAAQTGSLSDYAGAFYQDVATRSATATTNQTTQSDRLTEAQSRQSSVSGVNLDEELSNMMTYQQAYSAGARMLQTVQSLYDSLFQVQ
ncbi:MAG TPA: flagellar hook-associated protein FlgK [Rhizomicrobium sp.]|jgi:flagellar hook-associated protein 1 FlgK